MTATEPWMCPTCNRAVATPFCAQCGERRLHPRDLTLRGLFDQIASALTGAVARRLVAERVAAKQVSVESYAAVFDQSVATNYKSLIVKII